MRVSLRWLRELVAVDLDVTTLADRLTMAGFEVEEIEDRRTWAEGVVVGHILACEPHPNAQKLRVCQVDVGEREPRTIVCGAPNAAAGLYVPVALPGAYLAKIDLKIRPAKLRGVKSEGMICSLAELGLARESEGIHTFADSVTVGEDVRPLLGLDDVILHLTSTANRADALSMVGIAREVAALTGAPLTLPTPLGIAPKKSRGKAPVRLAIADSQACPAYCGTLITNVRIAPSPDWLQQRLEAAGLRAINNVVDITNYILLKWGQPLHAFDWDRLQAVASQTPVSVGVRFAKAGETLKTLDGEERVLSPDNLLITAGDVPVALAGVMGGEETEVHNATQNVFLEAALFASPVIRRSARAQGLRTEASARYERGVNPAELEAATAEAISLLTEIAQGTVTYTTLADQRPPLERTLTLRLEQVHRLLGAVVSQDEDSDELAYLDAETVEELLSRLGFHMTRQETFEDELVVWSVRVPPYRFRDIEREVDLIEEIARLYGYDRFEETLPAQAELGALPLELTLLRELRAAFRGAGLTELMHYSWVKGGQPNQVTVVNPLVSEFSSLRTDLITGLVQAFRYNQEQGNPPLNGFEIGRVFGQDEEGLWESDRLGGIIGGDPWQGKWVRRSQQAQPLTWYEAKGILESVFQRFGLNVEYQSDRQDERLHPGRTAALCLSGERLGIFGQLHPQYAATLDLPAAVYVFELDLEVLLSRLEERYRQITFQPFSTYPASDRDLAFFAPAELTVAELSRTIWKAAGGQSSLLESVEVFDEYSGTGVPAGQRSLAFRLTYRASDRTLTEAEVNELHQRIRDSLVEKYAVTLRS
ncbi:phenylalanine--tRNA ligase subunit beta [Thermosynechococcus sp. HN-54]|uniref:phenylalanine--tRNA ligase subunit beta n=1 Tax=Thermosynechococcus sp. HN-54 TaxID=2933959 RepID=UPI00202CC870|nr:phenylalanine--tRNA ligase subunit beta [Thermosynechococcus sp. HN-54]URR35790.1 phenylalanine--tRNA ligase subunit beta [Thermosynechococcus sp. HN-54]